MKWIRFPLVKQRPTPASIAFSAHRVPKVCSFAETLSRRSSACRRMRLRRSLRFRRKTSKTQESTSNSWKPNSERSRSFSGTERNVSSVEKLRPQKLRRDTRNRSGVTSGQPGHQNRLTARTVPPRAQRAKCFRVMVARLPTAFRGRERIGPRSDGRPKRLLDFEFLWPAALSEERGRSRNHNQEMLRPGFGK